MEVVLGDKITKGGSVLTSSDPYGCALRGLEKERLP